MLSSCLKPCLLCLRSHSLTSLNLQRLFSCTSWHCLSCSVQEKQSPAHVLLHRVSQGIVSSSLWTQIRLWGAFHCSHSLLRPLDLIEHVFTTGWSACLGTQALSMDEVGRPAGHSSTAGSSDRAATAAWRLFEPMQSAHPKAITSANQGLAESIATAMCEMTDCAEMALLWTEVCHTSVCKISSLACKL